MRSQLRSAMILAAASVAFTACTDEAPQPVTGPNATSLRPVSANIAVNACDATVLRGLIKDFAKSNKDPLYTILSDIQKNGPSNDKAFDGLSRIAAIRGTSDQNSGVAGSVFDGLVRGFLGCGSPSIVDGTLELPSGKSFGDALVASNGWLFEVRGKNAEPPASGPYKAGPYDDPFAPAYQRGGPSPSKFWAVDANPTASSPTQTAWTRSITSTGSPASSALPKRFLIYGYPVTDFLSSLTGVASRFEVRTIPRICNTVATDNIFDCTASTTTEFGISLKVGLCFNPTTDLTALRVNHANVFLPKASLNCGGVNDPTPITVASASTGFDPMNTLAMAARRVTGFFTPQPAYAAFIGGGLSGAVKDLSPSAVYDLSQITLTALDTFVNNGNNTTNLSTTGSYGVITVRANEASTGTPPVANVPIVLSVVGNNSIISYFNDLSTIENPEPDLVTVTRYTDANGIAKFDNVRLTKAGGYQLQMQIAFDGFAGPIVLTNKNIQIQNK